MSNRGGMQMQMPMPFTPVVKALVIANVAIWLFFQVILERLILRHPFIQTTFGMVPDAVVGRFFIWQVVTYMFLHSYNVFHILFNMLMLWWLGAELEQRWGSRFFFVYYMVSGMGAAVIYVLVWLGVGFVRGGLPGWGGIPVLGASGAIFGLLLAYGIIFGERIMLFMMVFPMRAKVFVAILGAVEAVTLLNSGVEGSDVSNLAHLGGIASGFIFLQLYTRFQQSRWRKESSKRGRGLKLVVNNERKDEKGGPRYWN